MKLRILGVLLLINLVLCLDLKIDPLVLIKQGLVRGQRATDGDYSSFLGIPYAEVDEDNPFGPAKPARAFEEEVYKANEGTIKCPQTTVFNFRPEGGIETMDCLRLNVYVPNDATTSNPLPVLVWIHGGAFGFGYAGQFGVRDLMTHGIVVVTINYRLGPYGFICLDVPTVTGNQGLKDQYDALRWIKDNIASFGGNPYNVTLSGQSAGACSTLLHLYSSKEKLFHKIIVESGTPQNYGMFVNGDTDAAVKLANYLGVNTTETETALEFLSTAPYSLVTAAATDLDLVLRPCKERSFSGVENFVDSDPFSLSNEKKIADMPILIGHTSKEEIHTVRYETDYYNYDPFYQRLAHSFNLDNETLSRVANIIRHFYIGDQAVTKEIGATLEDFESDFIFNHPSHRTVRNLLKDNASPVYEYMFSYVSDSGDEGAAHSGELRYLFNLPDDDKPRSEDDELIANRITTLWANFIKFGNPTPQGNSLSLTWTPVTPVSRPYLNIDKDMRMEHRIYSERMAFWDIFYDNYERYNSYSRRCAA